MAGFECTVEEKNNYKKSNGTTFFFYKLAWSPSNEFRFPDLVEAPQHVIQI